MNNLTDFPILQQHQLAAYTTWDIGGAAQLFAVAQNRQQLIKIAQLAHKNQQPLFVLGAGSNLLISDQGIPGWTVLLKNEFEQISFTQNNVHAAAGVFLPRLVRLCAEQGLGGIEPLVGVPGTIGGAIKMNAGTRDLEIGSIIENVEILDLESFQILNLSKSQIEFSYRCSSLKNCIVLSAILKLQQQNKSDILKNVQNFLTKRLKTQPVGSKNCGSVFKNPPGYFAAALIEQAGLKGFQIGQAQVSTVHANFIVNLGGASAQNVKDLILHIQNAVQQKFNIHLECEVKFVP